MGKVGRPKMVITSKELKRFEKGIEHWWKRVFKGMKKLFSPAFK